MRELVKQFKSHYQECFFLSNFDYPVYKFEHDMKDIHDEGLDSALLSDPAVKDAAEFMTGLRNRITENQNQLDAINAKLLQEDYGFQINQMVDNQDFPQGKLFLTSAYIVENDDGTLEYRLHGNKLKKNGEVGKLTGFFVLPVKE